LIESIIGSVKGFLALADGTGNQALIAGLVLALLGLLVGHVIALFQFRGRLQDKDKHIADLIKQRNKFQEIALNAKGLSRKSSKE
jgi:hypothetical protein